VLCLLSHLANADTGCLQYKVYPTVQVIVPEWSSSVVQPDEDMDFLHGNVAATFVEEYKMSVLAEPVDGGYCVVLKNIDAQMGYTDFLIQIDHSHSPESCGYNMTLEHEHEHVNAHIAAFDSMREDIKKSISAAADSIVPALIKDEKSVDAVLDKMQRDIQENPDIILIKQKLQAEQEIRNKKIDQADDNIKINNCPEIRNK
jgi:hypothetical protein